MKFLIMQLSLASQYFLHFRAKYSPMHHVLPITLTIPNTYEIDLDRNTLTNIFCIVDM
jgi:hypothetical protein